MNYQLENVNCYLCGSSKSDYFLTGQEDLTGKEGDFTYVKCQACSLVYQNPRIHVDQIKYFYDSEYIAHRKKKNWGMLTPLYEKAMNKHDSDKAKLVNKYVPLNEKTRVLDVGCAVGTFLLYVKKTFGSKISGVDFKEDLSYPGFDQIDFHQGLFYQQDFKDKKFDLITMWHFLEHCYDPKRSVQKAKELLAPGGVFIAEVPRLDSVTYRLFKEKWPGVQAPQHTVLFDKKNFIKIIEDSGLEVVEYLPYGAFPAYFYIFAGAYFKIFGKGLNLDRIIVPYFLGQLLLKPILFFEKKLNLSMQVIVCRNKK